MKALHALAAGFLTSLAACGSQQAPSTNRASGNLLRSAAQFYDAYVRDVREHRREKLSQYYHPNGALIVLGGQRKQFSRAAIDSFYRGPWKGPAYFAWDTLAFDSLSPEFVLVTGRFRWLRPGTTDTARYIYASILEMMDSGLAIRLEHETPAPVRQK